jgi:hypothetical protein
MDHAQTLRQPQAGIPERLALWPGDPDRGPTLGRPALHSM